MARLPTCRVLHADKGYDSDAIRRQVKANGTAPNNKNGQALVTPALATADEFESSVNTLQAELNETRVQGRRLFGDVP